MMLTEMLRFKKKKKKDCKEPYAILGTRTQESRPLINLVAGSSQANRKTKLPANTLGNTELILSDCHSGNCT